VLILKYQKLKFISKIKTLLYKISSIHFSMLSLKQEVVVYMLKEGRVKPKLFQLLNIIELQKAYSQGNLYYPATRNQLGLLVQYSWFRNGSVDLIVQRLRNRIYRYYNH
jgi:hypothetical protein